METTSELEHCKHLIETSLGWGDPASWTNEDFDTLSDRIFESTSVRLSVSTLKRIWGKVRYDSSPTTATLNALARFAGFDGWRDFLARETAKPSAPALQQPTLQPATPQQTTAQQQTTQLQPSQPQRPRKFILPVIVITVILAALLSFISARIIHKPPTDAPVTFAQHRTSDELPNSVIFDYDATALNPRTVMIQQSWDPNRREKVDPNGKQHTSIYYYPGYFRAKLVVDGHIRKESDVYIPTKGWKAIIGKEPQPVYLSTAEATVDSGRMGITAHTLETKTGSPVFSNRSVDFLDVHEFPGIRGDHFLLSATVRNTSTVEQCLCRNIHIGIMGTENPIIIPLTAKGCISSLGLFTGFSGVSGRDHDLSAFGCNVGQWQQVVCAQENQILTIRLNGNLIYTLPHNKSIGNIIGIRITFEGTGEIKEVHLKGDDDMLDLLKEK